jgi:ribosomal protein S18 acetylase RimI-like enzyme
METYRRALESKGLSHLIPAGMLRGREVSRPREASSSEARQLANLHFDLILGGFLPRLGRRFLRVLYSGLLDWEGTKAFVVEDEAGVVGFVVGVQEVGSFYKWFVRRHGLRAAISALPALLNPGHIRRAWESLRYGGGHSELDDVSAEVLSLGVAQRARGAGASKTLLDAVLTSLDEADAGAVKVVVGSDNDVAIRAYERAGFGRASTIEVHKGETSEVLVWRPR